MSQEETLELISGLAAVAKEQSASKNSRAEELKSLAFAVKDLSNLINLQSQASPGHAALRLPNLTLPEYTGIEDLDRFLDQFNQVLRSSGANPKFYLTYLKQQCRKDSRAFDILCNYESTHLVRLPASPTSDDYYQFYNAALMVLHSQRGIPKDQQIRNLLATYYSMRQQHHESVSNFAHRFCETQHSLEKLIPGIHMTADGNEIELIHAFALKLREDISRDLFARDFNYPTLVALIEAAKRYETKTTSIAVDEPISTANALPVTPVSAYPRKAPAHRQEATPNPPGELCLQYNKYPRAFCELSNGKCKKVYIHKCTKCGRFNCKAVRHNRTKANSHYNSVEPKSLHTNIAKVEPSVDSDTTSLLKSIHSLLLTSKAHVAPPKDEAVPPKGGSQDNVYSMPAISLAPDSVTISNLDLANRNILWCSVSSAGVSLPLPLGPCCSVSLVSKAHADKVLETRPDNKFSRLEQPVKVSVASPSASLKAVGIMQVPLQFENGRSATFSMLVVPNLSWPVLFGQNHLRKTDARINSRALTVYFADKGLEFEV